MDNSKYFPLDNFFYTINIYLLFIVNICSKHLYIFHILYITNIINTRGEKMSIRHYVLLATDGLIQLPLDGDLCTENRKEVYIFGFTGGLLEVDGVTNKENEYLDYKNPTNWNKILK